MHQKASAMRYFVSRDAQNKFKPSFDHVNIRSTMM
jgi:hypothetical protein